MTLGLADRALRRQAEDNAGRATEDPRIRKLLVEAESACCAHSGHVRTVRAESRMITAQASKTHLSCLPHSGRCFRDAAKIATSRRRVVGARAGYGGGPILMCTAGCGSRSGAALKRQRATRGVWWVCGSFRLPVTRGVVLAYTPLIPGPGLCRARGPCAVAEAALCCRPVAAVSSSRFARGPCFRLSGWLRAVPGRVRVQNLGHGARVPGRGPVGGLSGWVNGGYGGGGPRSSGEIDPTTTYRRVGGNSADLDTLGEGQAPVCRRYSRFPGRFCEFRRQVARQPSLIASLSLLRRDTRRYMDGGTTRMQSWASRPHTRR